MMGSVVRERALSCKLLPEIHEAGEEAITITIHDTTKQFGSLMLCSTTPSHWMADHEAQQALPIIVLLNMPTFEVCSPML